MNNAAPDRSSLILPARQPRSLARQTGIIHAGLELLKTRSFEELTMEQMAKHADCSVGTLYKHFRNKAALLQVLTEAAISEIFEVMERNITEGIGADDTFEAALRSIVEFLVDLFRRRQSLLREVFHRQYSNREVMGKLKATRSQIVGVALAKTLPLRPLGFSEAEYGRKFRIGMQMAVGTLNNAVQTNPGPLTLDDDEFINELSGMLLAYIQPVGMPSQHPTIR
jgi:AcrR family transcriptional regulator